MIPWAWVGAWVVLGVAGHPADGARKVDLNRAGVEALMALPGVGRVRAEAIVTHRRRRPFRRVSDLMQVRGIGRRLYLRIRPHVTVSPGSSAGGLRAGGVFEEHPRRVRLPRPNPRIPCVVLAEGGSCWAA